MKIVLTSFKDDWRTLPRKKPLKAKRKDVCSRQINGLSLRFWYLSTNQLLSICGIWLRWAREKWEQMTKNRAPACLWAGDCVWCRKLPTPSGWTMAPWRWAPGTPSCMASEAFWPFSGLLGFKKSANCLSSESSSFRYSFIARGHDGLVLCLSPAPGTLCAVR